MHHLRYSPDGQRLDPTVRLADVLVDNVQHVRGWPPDLRVLPCRTAAFDVEFASRDEFAAFFERLDVCGPGITVPPHGAATEADVSTYAAVGRKP